MLFLLLPLLASGAPSPGPCCTSKTVGGLEYKLVREDSSALSLSCLSPCIYQRAGGAGGPEYCFARGEQTVFCGNGTSSVNPAGGAGVLRNHPNCGQTPNGKAECYFDCLVHSAPITSGQVVSNLECLDDCFSSEEGRCVASLLKDVIRSGTCDQEYSPGIWGVTTTCQYSTPDFVTTFSPSVTSGTCSSLTEELLQEPACKRVIQQQQGLIKNTLQIIIQNSCVNNPFRITFEPPGPSGGPPSDFRSRVKRGASWFVTEDSATSVASSELGGYKTLLEYEHTRGRYPWICSLRLAGSGHHLCGVTLLSTPPLDTVVVTSAHCTLHCSSRSRARLPSCCCSEPGQQQCGQEVECGGEPRVRSIPASSLEVLCGGWQLGEEEEEEVLLPVTEVIRHPDYSIELGPGQGSDIAVIKVEDEELAKKINAGSEIYPACLPLEEQPNSGVHAGWSNPPTEQFLQKYGTGFLKYYEDFSKQWHYKMDVQPACRDPRFSQIFGNAIKEPSNSWYPPGSLCAKDFSRQSCFNPGDSGSPLMARSNASQKLHAQGILSFSKGCDIFTLGAGNEQRTEWQLTQHSENPAVYLQLSCFLPWVAGQFGLAYEGPTACSKEEGMKETNQPCTETISNLFASQQDCIFPFIFEGQEYRECIQFSQDGFTLPVFQCPVRNITTKVNGVSSFSFIETTHGYCLDRETGELDPEAECPAFLTVPPFSQCKNDCPGVQAFGLASTN